MMTVGSTPWPCIQARQEFVRPASVLANPPGLLDMADGFLPGVPASLPELDPRTLPSQVAPRLPSPELETNAQELEKAWAARLGPGGAKSIVGVVAMDSEVKSKHVYLTELADAILDSGGMPKLLFAGRGDAKQQMAQVDSLLLPGGDDINPAMYGQARLPTTDEPNIEFDGFEKGCTDVALDKKMPLLGICRGEQFLAAATGGKLFQRIEAQHPSPLKVEHWDDAAAKDRSLRKNSDHGHQIMLDPSSRLHKILGPVSKAVNTIHHQAIAVVGPLFFPIAWSPDGIIEGIQRKDVPWQSGVQFHPEWLRLEQPVYQKMFDTLIDDGVKYHGGNLNIPVVGNDSQYVGAAGNGQGAPINNPRTLTQM